MSRLVHATRWSAAVLVAALVPSCAPSCAPAPAGPAPTTTTTIQPVARPATEPAPWPAPPNPIALSAKAGLASEPAEVLAYHVHSHLDVFVNGQPQVVPAGIGIDISNPAVQKFDLDNGTVGYGLAEPCTAPCISPLHTHDPTGIIHTESASATPHRLGQFFTQWGVTLNANCVGGYCRPKDAITVYVDGQATAGDPSSIELANGREIAIVIGPPPASIPSTFDPSAA